MSRTKSSTKSNIDRSLGGDRQSTRGVPTLSTGLIIKYYWAESEWYVGTLSKNVKNPKGAVHTQNPNPCWWLVKWFNDPSDSIVDLSPATFRLRRPGQWMIVDQEHLQEEINKSGNRRNIYNEANRASKTTSKTNKTNKTNKTIKNAKDAKNAKNLSKNNTNDNKKPHDNNKKEE
jgi:hypothetical protein